MEYRACIYLIVCLYCIGTLSPANANTVQKACFPNAYAGSSYCTQSRDYYKLESQGGSWWSYTTYYAVKVTRYVQTCCPGYGGSGCKPMCHGRAELSGCNRYEGNVKHKDGTTVTCSGGACTGPNTCTSCNTGYYADNTEGYCRACDPIANCNIPVCTQAGASSCSWCEGEVQYGFPGRYAFTSHLDSTQCQRACSWRSSYRCFPGTCNANMLFSSCQCSEGFTGSDCATFDNAFSNKLHILDPELVLNTNTASDPSLIVPDPAYPTAKKWTNEVTWAKLDVSVTTSFDAPAILDPAPYIDKEHTKIGVESVRFEADLSRGTTGTSYTETKNCGFVTPCLVNKRAVSMSTTPWNSILSAGGSFSHGDRILFTVFLTNGGQVFYYNRVNGQKESYDLLGMTVVSNPIELGFDLYPPQHCLETDPSCATQPLLTQDFTTSATFDITWGGWTDADSNMRQYHIDVYPLHVKDLSTKLLEKDHRIIFNTIVSHSSPGTTSISVNDRGVYIVELRAEDWAGNTKSTRRIFMFDDDSEITLINSPVYVTTASEETNYRWINTQTDIEIMWENRFINVDHVTNYWLNDVKQSDFIARELDDTNTISARNLTGIHHIQGIVQVKVSYTKTAGLDPTVIQGGTVTVPKDVFDKQKYIVPEDLVDGKQINITVQALDVMNASNEETTSIFIDLSPPEFQNMWLTKGDILNISVHSVEELNLVTFEWELYDIHSGVYNVSWRLYDNYTNTDIIHGTASETPQGDTQTLAECESHYGSYARGHNCYCTPFSGCFHQHYQIKPSIVTGGSGGILSGKETGVHESEYFFEVTAFNHARLRTTVSFKVTIDTSPPHSGIVQDGMTGMLEVDFQQSHDINAHWSGFLDKESGVFYYMFAFGTACLPSTAFDHGTTVALNQTYSTNAAFMAPSNGTYYITVAAYNHALDHSEPVCSDGVTVDADLPDISEVVVGGTSTREGLLKDTDDRVWYLNNERILEEIDSPSQICLDKATPVTIATVSSFPKRVTGDGSMSMMLSSNICNTSTGVSSPIMSYISTDAHLIISWNMTQTVSGIHDYKVGLSTDGIAADITAFISTNHHQHTKLVYPNVWNGQEFYILLKGISKSAVEIIKVVGPFIVETVGPDASSVIVSLGYEDVSGQGYLVSSWEKTLFTSPSGHLTNKYTFAIGSTANGHDLLPFQDLMTGGSCSTTSCTAVAVSKLPWNIHGHQSYYLTVKATNVVGLFTMATSAAYINDVELASAGIVLDVKATSTELIEDIEDVDFQTSTDTMSAKWTGFAHPHLNITFYVCVREGNGTAFMFCEQASGNTTHSFTSLVLVPFVTYYQDVIAQTSVGNVTVSSDGVTVVTEDTTLSGIMVYDGEVCNQLDTAFPNLPNASHHTGDKRMVCQNEVDYQSATNVLRAYWTIPIAMTTYVPDVFYAIEQKHSVTGMWTQLVDYKHIKTSDHIKVTGLYLDAGQKYRVTLKLCAMEYCFEPVSSNGVTIVPTPPTPGTVNVTYNSASDMVSVQVSRFKDPDISDSSEAEDVMDHYEWAFTDNSKDGKLLTKWSTEYITDSSADPQVSIRIPSNRTISQSKCLRVSVRGYTKAGLSSVISETLMNCSNTEEVSPSLVIDAVGEPLKSADSSVDTHEGQPIVLKENNYWEEVDKDYTPYKNIISATWPTLRYDHYVWAVLELQALDPTVFYKRDNLNLNAPCSHPDAIQCGDTSEEYMNALFSPGELVHGRRYIVCIAANATSIRYEKWTLYLNDTRVCSDGITVDLTPPIPAEVWLGSNMNTNYQITSTDMTVNWKPYVDVEEANYSVHASGISHYEVALGSSKTGVDISDFVNVGLTNHHTFHSLQLQSGHSYYAMVRATDFTGQTSYQSSQALKVDSSPPLLTTKAITLEERYITDTTCISACWKGVFVDLESGMSHYLWSVGTFQGYDDMMSYTETTLECATSDVSQPLELKDGHAYFVSVKGFNRAGQYTLAVSWAFVVDATPPVTGHVYDGVRPDSGLLQDIDYSTSTTTVAAHWTDFYEPHGALREYTVHVGSCAGCDDILALQTVGIANDITVESVHMVQGQRYFVTVTACNTAGLCTTASSDGFICDSSPPIPGRVIDGINGRDIQYQTSRIYLGAEWYGFTDPQSGLSHYVWRVGTTAGGDDILSAENVHLSQEAHIIDLQSYKGCQLPVGVQLFVTVRAYNNAGMYTEATSNGLLVDTTPPVFTTPLSLSHIGSAVTLTSALRSNLRVEWILEDQESYIDEQYLSITSHIGGDFNMSSIKVEGIVRDYMFTGLELHDGSSYDVTIVSCNGARTCNASALQNILVDSSPPTPGTFAINTDHAAALSRQDATWMTWTILYVNLAWLGFEDEHSGIDRYLINFGSTYMGDDLNKVFGVPMVISHATNGTSVDEGLVQVHQIDTASLARTSTLFVSIWAINGVGLPSPVLHAHFSLVYGGSMFMVRRCEAETCQGHCVCAPHGQLCNPSLVTCQDVSSNNPNSLIDVEDVLDLRYPTSMTSPRHSPLSTMMAARWSISQSAGLEPAWYEWSVGLTSQASPTGVFNTVTDRLWHGAGRNMTWMISLDPDLELTEGLTYSFFVRAWYNANTFAIFKSPGVLVNSHKPKTTSINGKAVKEVEHGDEKDLDFFDNGLIAFVDWTGKFLNNDNSIQKFHLYISTYPGGHDVEILSKDVPATTTTYNITGLQYVEGTTYYCVVQAFNLAGLHTTETSDGFVIDNSPPTIGTVNDGEVVKDVKAISSVDIIQSFWHGFVDDVSSIRSYNVCLSSIQYRGSCDIHPQTNVGLQNSARLVPTVTLKDGQTVITEVYAFDTAGHMSVRASSTGVTIDTTPPVRAADYIYSSNVMINPSFEIDNAGRSVDNLADLSSADCSIPDSWLVEDGSCAIIVLHGTVGALPEGSNFVVVLGTFTQELRGLSSPGHYRLTFYTSYIETDTSVKSAAEISVTVANTKHVLLLYRKPTITDSSSAGSTFNWQKHTLFFTIHQPNITVSLETVGPTTHFALDNVVLEHVVIESTDVAQKKGHVKAHIVFVHDWASIHATWNFVDDESGIVEYLWAVGTVEGGTQLQPFTTVGRRTFAFTSSLTLVHDTTAFVTVLAINGAGLKTLSYSQVILVDKTPPTFTWIYDGLELDKDLDFQSDTDISANWHVQDNESGVSSCYFAVGSASNPEHLQSFMDIVTSAQSISVSFTTSELGNSTIYVTVRCTNGAGLTTTTTTDGVKIMMSPPSIRSSILEVIPMTLTQYPVRDGYHADSSQVRFRWTGFNVNEGIDSYLVSLDGAGVHMDELVDGTTAGYTFADFLNIDLPDGTYTVSVTAINSLQMYSPAKTADFTISTEAPSLTGTLMTSAWDHAKQLLTAGWTAVFTSHNPMYYEVTVSRVDGGNGDTIQWQGTTETNFSAALGVEGFPVAGVDLRITVRAISYSGYYTSTYREQFITT